MEPAGRRFIEFAKSQSTVVKALYGFNEPIWVNPHTGANEPCGALSGGDLRQWRNAVRKIWPEAMIYHDFGRPSLWAPGGSMERDHAGCVGQRYADMAEVADYVGVWYYPVNAREGYQREELVRSLREEVAYVTRRMKAETVLLGQAFRCDRCKNGTRMPSESEMQDLNCTMRWIAPMAISWYPWRQPAYDDSFASHPELWPASGPGACPAGGGAELESR